MAPPIKPIVRTVTTAPPSDDPAQFDQAVDAFNARIPMTRAEWDTLAEAEQEFAFTVSRVAQADLVTTVYDKLAAAVRDGTTFEDFQDQVGDQLIQAWGGDIPGRLQTIFRTNVQTAYNAGRFQQMNDPDVKEARPFWQFDGIADSRQSEICADCDGVILPADDAWWTTHHPPLHHQCRSKVSPLDPDEAGERGISDSGPTTKADPGFGRAPTVGTSWKPEVDVYPDAIRDVLVKDLDEGGTADLRAHVGGGWATGWGW